MSDFICRDSVFVLPALSAARNITPCVPGFTVAVHAPLPVVITLQLEPPFTEYSICLMPDALLAPDAG